MWDWITDHLFVATLPLCAIMAYCALKYAEAKAIKDYPDKYVKMSKKKLFCQGTGSCHQLFYEQSITFLRLREVL